MKSWIARQRYLIDYTLAALARRRFRNASLFAVYTALVFVLASVMLYTNSLRHEAAQVLDGAPEVVVQRLVAGRQELVPPGYLTTLSEIRGVRSVERRLWGYYYDTVVPANYTFMVPAVGAPARGHIVVGHGVAVARGIGPGDIISFRAYSGMLVTFTVERVLSERSELVSADLIQLSEPDFRAFFGIPAGYATDIALRVANPLEVRTVAAKIRAAAPDSRPILREEMLRTYTSVFNWREGIVLTVLVGALFAFAIFAWDKAAGLSAEERREIGILKAIGWESGDVMAMKLWEGAIVSLTAFLLGYVLAYVHVFHSSAFLFEPVLKGWAVLYPHFTLVPHIDGLQIVTLFFFTVFPYTLATLVPVWRAAITDPDAVMRS